MENKKCELSHGCRDCHYSAYCQSCYNCNFCRYCYYSRDLRMTEDNLFCWGSVHDSFQQKRFRIFNELYNKEDYNNILRDVMKILRNTSYLNITQTQIKLLKAIPNLKFDDIGFTHITGIYVEKDYDVNFIHIPEMYNEEKNLTDVEKAIELLTSKGIIRDGKVIHLS